MLFVAGALALVAFIVFAAPRLQDQAAALLGEDSEVLQTGTLGGAQWVVSVIGGQDRTCLVTELDGRRAAETCFDPRAGLLGPVAVAVPGKGESGYVLTGITDAPQVRVDLDDGQVRIPRVYRPRGFPAGYYTTTVEPGIGVEQVVALDLDEHELAVRACRSGPLATADGEAAGCATRQSGGQG